MLLQLERPTPKPSISIERVTRERLSKSGYTSLRDVSCLAAEDVLVLEGRLPSHYLKQVAQEIALSVSGVRGIVNRIKVPRLTASDRTRPEY